MNPELKTLKAVLETLEEQEPYTEESYYYSALAVCDLIHFVYNDKDAEEMLRQLLRHRDYRIRSMVIKHFLKMKMGGLKLENKTEIRLLQVKNSPIDHKLYEAMAIEIYAEDTDQKEEAARYN